MKPLISKEELVDIVNDINNNGPLNGMGKFMDFYSRLYDHKRQTVDEFKTKAIEVVKYLESMCLYFNIR